MLALRCRELKKNPQTIVHLNINGKMEKDNNERERERRER